MKAIIFLLILLLNISAYSQKLEPTETEALINVTVTNFKEVPRLNESIIFESNKNNKQYQGITDDKGKFSLLLPKGQTYSIMYSNYKENVEYNKLKVDSTKDLESISVKIKIEPPKTFVLDNVLFDTGKASLKGSSFKALNNLVELMKMKSGMIIEIGGHTDNTGKHDINLKLSQSRANTVRNYLIKKGITPNRVKAKGYGDTQPVAPNDTEEGRKQNRRTEVNIIKE
jgi:OmpA-OmpF porin, OOP family